MLPQGHNNVLAAGRNTSSSFPDLPPELVQKVFSHAADLLREEFGEPPGLLDDEHVRALQRWQLSLCLISRACLSPGRKSAYQELRPHGFKSRQLSRLLQHFDYVPWQPARMVFMLNLHLKSAGPLVGRKNSPVPPLLDTLLGLPCLKALECYLHDPLLPVTGDDLLARLTTSQLERLELLTNTSWPLSITSLIELVVRCPVSQLSLFGSAFIKPAVAEHTPQVLQVLATREIFVHVCLKKGTSLPALLWGLGPSLHRLTLMINVHTIHENGEYGIDYTALGSRDLALFPNAGQYLRDLALTVLADKVLADEETCILSTPLPPWLFAHLVRLDLNGNFDFCLLALCQQLPASLVTFSARGRNMKCLTMSFFQQWLRGRKFLPSLASFSLHAFVDTPAASICAEAIELNSFLLFRQRGIKTDLYFVCDPELECDPDKGRSCHHCVALAESGGMA